MLKSENHELGEDRFYGARIAIKPKTAALSPSNLSDLNESASDLRRRGGTGNQNRKVLKHAGHQAEGLLSLPALFFVEILRNGLAAASAPRDRARSRDAGYDLFCGPCEI